MHFVSFEVRNITDGLCWLRSLATLRRRPFVTVGWMVTVVYLAPELARTMKPWARANEDAPGEPFWPVVAIGSAIIGSEVIEAIGTDRLRSDLDADLRFCLRGSSD